MGKIIITTLLALGLSGCAASLHTIYRDADRGVSYENPKGERIECPLTYSSWDGVDHTDYYGAPCFVFIKRMVTALPNLTDPRSTR